MGTFNWHKQSEHEWDQRAPSWKSRSKQMWDHGSRKDIIPFIQKHTSKGESILDVGCGDGYASYKLFTLGYRVDGVDLSRKMIEYARQQVHENEINFLQADARALPFKGNSFDNLLVINVLEWTSVPADTLQELSRVLKKGGSLFIGILGPAASPRRQGYPRVYGKKTICHPMLPWEFQQLAAENGFTYGDGFGVYKQGVKKENLKGLSLQLKQALSFMWVFKLEK